MANLITVPPAANSRAPNFSHFLRFSFHSPLQEKNKIFGGWSPISHLWEGKINTSQHDYNLMNPTRQAMYISTQH